MSNGQLTERELAVLKLIAEGVPNRALAERLHISERTARNHVSNLRGKLKAHSKLEAVAKARQLGLLRNGEGPSLKQLLDLLQTTEMVYLHEDGNSAVVALVIPVGGWWQQHLPPEPPIDHFGHEHMTLDDTE